LRAVERVPAAASTGRALPQPAQGRRFVHLASRTRLGDLDPASAVLPHIPKDESMIGQTFLQAPFLLALLALGTGTPEVAVDAPVTPAAESPAGAPAARELLALRADVVHLGDGRTVENGTVLIEDGRIRAVGASVDVPSGTPTVQLHGHLAPGFVLPHSSLLPIAERFDATRGFLPDAAIVHAFRPESDALSKALAAGVTTVVLAPTEGNVVGGVTGVVKTAGGRVLKRRAHLALSMSNAAVDDRRFPTSFSGLTTELRRLFTAGEGVYGEVKSGTLPVLVAARERHHVARAVDLGAEMGFKGALIGAALAGEQLDILDKSGWTVVFETPGPNINTRIQEAMADYAKSGNPFAFSYVDADGMRMATAQLLRRGVSPDAVLRALTVTGAQVAGVGGRVGQIERGFDADLVLWSGHPLELSSAPVVVYVDGKAVHRASTRPASTRPASTRPASTRAKADTKHTGANR